MKVPTALADLARENQRFINGTVIRSRGDILAPKNSATRTKIGRTKVKEDNIEKKKKPSHALDSNPVRLAPLIKHGVKNIALNTLRHEVRDAN